MKKILAIAVATAISAPAMADLTIGGSARYQVNDTDSAMTTAGRVTASITGTAASEAGATASYNLGLVYNMGAAAGAETVVENNMLSLGMGDVAVKLGEFEMTKAFSSGDDIFEVTADADTTDADAGTVAGYENSTIRGRNTSNVEVIFTGVEGVTLGAGTRLQDADTSVQLSAATAMGGVSVAAVYESANAAGVDNGYTVTAGTEVEGIALNASYGKAGDVSSMNLNAGYMGFAIAYQQNDNSTSEDTKLYGTYTFADVMGIPGASVIVGAGSSDVEGTLNADSETMGVRLNYAF